jgi:hypothetical protein
VCSPITNPYTDTKNDRQLPAGSLPAHFGHFEDRQRKREEAESDYESGSVSDSGRKFKNGRGKAKKTMPMQPPLDHKRLETTKSDVGLRWRRGKYSGCFPGAVPLLHSLFRSEHAHNEREKRLQELAKKIHFEQIRKNNAEINKTTNNSAASPIPSPMPPASPDKSANRRPAIYSSSKPLVVAKRPLNAKVDRFRKALGVCEFLQASVKGLTELPLSEVVSLAFMFNWADTRQR